ncbi:hypothetical protein EDC04DRAFT_2624824 [Pisolithus marmoratus]|nr:hypothetical protein EDC04DRAFT_2624824 [Pisolithus marmoratus]
MNSKVTVHLHETQTEMAAPAQFLFNLTMQLIKYPTPSRSNSKFYLTADDYTSSYPAILMPNQISSSISSQEHLGHLFPVHPYHTRPADLSGFHESCTGSKMEPHSTSTVDSRTAHVPSDRPPPSPSDHRVHPFGNHATCILDYPPAGCGVDDYGRFDKNSSNLTTLRLHAHNRLYLRTDSCCHSPNFILTTMYPVLMVRTSHGSQRGHTQFVIVVCIILCGWRGDSGRKCGMHISYGDCVDHFAAIHDIENITRNVKVTCRWCPSKTQKKIVRKNLLRRLREVHLRCLRSKNRNSSLLSRIR